MSTHCTSVYRTSSQTRVAASEEALTVVWAMPARSSAITTRPNWGSVPHDFLVHEFVHAEWAELAPEARILNAPERKIGL